MPLIEDSTYRAPFGFWNGHVQTIAPRLFRALPPIRYRRERIETDDGDFLDLDWWAEGRERLAILSYGMEGTAQSDYVLGMAAALRAADWDVLVWNYRGCGGEPNRKVHFYHGGLIGDLHAVVAHALREGRYAAAALVGFSLGGNLILNYMGHRGRDVPPEIKRAVALSAPVDVEDCARALHRFGGGIYVRRFLRFFHDKIRAKMKAQPGRITDENFAQIRSLEDYDTVYTVPHFGMGTPQNFYKFVSSRYVLPHVRVPTLILNAKNDPFMGPDCYPVDAAQSNPNLTLEIPATGGHLGFITSPWRGANWSEKRTVSFLNA